MCFLTKKNVFLIFIMFEKFEKDKMLLIFKDKTIVEYLKLLI